jgi:hypothetical protein
MRTTSNKKKSVPRVRSKVRKAGSGGPNLHRLSPTAVRSLLKPHVGFEAFVEPLAKLVEKYSAELYMRGIDIEKMRASFADIVKLDAQRAEAAEHTALLDNSRGLAASDVWKQMLIIYAAARQAGEENGDIDGAIGGFESFMKTGPRKPAQPAVTPPVATTTTTTT